MESQALCRRQESKQSGREAGVSRIKKNVSRVLARGTKKNGIMKKTKKTIKQPYQVILKTSNQEFKARGETLLEAIDNLEVDPIAIRTFGILVAKKGKLSAERRYNTIFKLKRLLNNKVLKTIIAKNLELAMK